MKSFALRIWAWLAIAVAWLAANRADLLSTAALATLAYGCWLAWEPLGFIVVGVCVYLPPLVIEIRAAWLMLTPPKDGD